MPTESSADSLFRTQQPLCVEAWQEPLTLTREFDGIIWIKTVHAPDFTPFVLVISMVHYRKALMIVGIGLVLATVLVPAYLVVRRRKRGAT